VIRSIIYRIKSSTTEDTEECTQRYTEKFSVIFVLLNFLSDLDDYIIRKRMTNAGEYISLCPL
jgi:hypothetical protein